MGEEAWAKAKEDDLAACFRLAISLSPHEQQQYNAARRQARAGGDWNISNNNSNNNNNNNEHGRRYVGKERAGGDAR